MSHLRHIIIAFRRSTILPFVIYYQPISMRTTLKKQKLQQHYYWYHQRKNDGDSPFWGKAFNFAVFVAVETAIHWCRVKSRGSGGVPLQTHLTRGRRKGSTCGLAGRRGDMAQPAFFSVRGNSYKAGVGGECALATALDVSIMGVLLWVAGVTILVVDMVTVCW